MSVPNQYGLVVEKIGPRLKIVGDEEATRANSFWAVNDVCHDARATDPHWGLLIKSGGAMVEQRAADVWLYDLGNGTAQVVDIVGNAEGAPPPEGGARTAPVPAWGEKDIRQIAEWVAPYPRSDGGTDSGSGDSDALQQQLDALSATVAAQAAQLAELQQQVDAHGAQLAQPLRAHGPVNLPVVLESITSLRAKGDIDVQIKPGTATPPTSSDGEPLDAGGLKRLIER